MNDFLIVKILLWVSIIWLPYYMRKPMSNEAEFKKNICIGVTMPYYGRDDEEVRAVTAAYKQSLNKVALWLTILGAIFAFIPCNFSIAMGLWGFWLLLAIVGMQIPFIKGNKELKKIKADRGWKKDEQNIITVNTSALPNTKWIHPAVFFALALIPLIPIPFESRSTPICIIMAATNLFLYFSYRYLFRNKSETIDDNVELTQALTRIRKRQWGKVFVSSAVSLDVVALAYPFASNSGVVYTVVIIAVTLAICGYCLKVEMDTRKLQEKLTADSGKGYYVDDDEHWLLGFIYYNPDDKHLVINNRTGSGSTVNLANPAGKVIVIICVLMLVCLPFMEPMLNAIIKSDITITETADAYSAVSGKTSYTIEKDDIASVQHCDAVPNGLSKSYGTNSTEIFKGDFTLPDIGHVNVCINPPLNDFLLIETNEGEYYLINAK